MLDWTRFDIFKNIKNKLQPSIFTVSNKKIYFSTRKKKIIDCFRRDFKSPKNFFLISNATSKIKNVNNSILNKIIINIPISVFQFYSLRFNNPNNFNLSILKKQTFLLKQHISFWYLFFFKRFISLYILMTFHTGGPSSSIL